MLLREAVFCWTPDRSPFDKFATAGQIFVTTTPVPVGDYGYMKTYGRTNAEWTNATNEQRREKLKSLVDQMVHQDYIAEYLVLDALSAIEDVDLQWKSSANSLHRNIT